MKRHLRKNIQTIIEIALFIELGFIASIHSFELSTLPVVIAILLMLVFNTIVLNKYGRY